MSERQGGFATRMRSYVHSPITHTMSNRGGLGYELIDKSSRTSRTSEYVVFFEEEEAIVMNSPYRMMEESCWMR